MPSYRAIANGNWSATGTWNVWSGSAWVAATVVPTTGDDVWSNNFTVTINQNVSVLSLRNTTTGAPGSGTVAGGGFQITTGGFTVTCSTALLGTTLGATNLITITAASGTTTINVSFTGAGTAGAGAIVNITGASTVNINGDFSVSNAINGIIRLAAACTVNLVGTLTASLNNNDGRLIVCSVANYTLNITGSLIQPNTTFVRTYIIQTTATGTINIIGNVTNNTTNSTTEVHMILLGAATTITVTGDCTGGQVYNNHTCINSTVNSNVSVFGIVRAGNAGNNGQGSPAIFNTGVSSITLLSGPFVFGNYGAMPFIGARVFLTNNTSNNIEFASNSTNGALFPSAAPTRMTMYSPNTLADAPAQSDVRKGVSYALGSQEGTLHVPAPSQVALGIPTDNTVGTAALTPQSVWNHLLSAISTTGSIGKLIKDLLDASISSRLASDGYTAPANTDIAAIKAKTDNLPANPADEVTSQAVLTGLGNIQVDAPTVQEISERVWTDQPDRLKNVATVESTGNQIASL